LRRGPIKSTARTLEVLELFMEVRAPLRLHNIVERLGYPQSSSTALLKSLVVLGYLNYHRASRTYFPTTKVSSLGDWINTVTYGSGKLIRLMRAVHERTGVAITLASQNDLFVQYNRVIASPEDRLRITPSEGFMRLLPHSTGGLVLLSRMSNKAVDKLIRHINALPQVGGEKIVLGELIETLDWVRREGYSFMTGFPTQEIASLAVPLPDAPHSIPLALGAGAFNSDLTRRKREVIGIMREEIAVYAELLHEHDWAEPEDEAPA
jgi:DNA-binding IclR family transcriptional regulator